MMPSNSMAARYHHPGSFNKSCDDKETASYCTTSTTSSGTSAADKAQELLDKLHEKQERLFKVARDRLDTLESSSSTGGLQKELNQAHAEIERLRAECAAKDQELMEQSLKLFEAGRLESRTQTTESMLQDELAKAQARIEALEAQLATELQRGRQLEQSVLEAMKRELDLKNQLEEKTRSKNVSFSNNVMDTNDNWTTLQFGGVPSQVALEQGHNVMTQSPSSNSMFSELSEGEESSAGAEPSASGPAMSVYETSKGVWRTAKGVFVFRPWMGLTECVAGSVVGLTGNSMRDVDSAIAGNMEGLDSNLLQPIAGGVSWAVVGTASNAVNTVLWPWKILTGSP